MKKKQNKKALIQFPCDFEIKVMGRADDDFEQKILTVIRQYCHVAHIKTIKKRHSQKNNYLSLSITVFIETRGQIDEIYNALHNTPDVLMTL